MVALPGFHLHLTTCINIWFPNTVTAGSGLQYMDRGSQSSLHCEVALTSYSTFTGAPLQAEESLWPTLADPWKDPGCLSSSVALPVRSGVGSESPALSPYLNNTEHCRAPEQAQHRNRLEAGTLKYQLLLDLFPVLGPFSSLLLPIFS